MGTPRRLQHDFLVLCANQAALFALAFATHEECTLCPFLASLVAGEALLVVGAHVVLLVHDLALGPGADAKVPVGLLLHCLPPRLLVSSVEVHDLSCVFVKMIILVVQSLGNVLGVDGAPREEFVDVRLVDALPVGAVENQHVARFSDYILTHYSLVYRDPLVR